MGKADESVHRQCVHGNGIRTDSAVSRSAHKHKVFEHAWYVPEGSLTVQLETALHTLEKGSFLFVPKKAVHAFSNKTGAAIKVLVIDTPGGFEHCYQDLQAAFGEGKAIDRERMREIQLKYDTYPPDYLF